MPIPTLPARRTPTPGRLGLACAAALALTAGTALAQSADLGRVEISGRVFEAPTRYDVLASCTQVEARLQQDLESAWWREQRPGLMDVRFAVTDGKVVAVTTRSGLSFRTARDVRRAVGQLDCPGAKGGTSLYRMQIVFIDPDDMPTRVAGADRQARVALVEMR
ncbi:MAG: hypothetical protein GXC94_10720 [Comamonadaceae bacterium]|jgi:hypothetical protein|nr:hypothetical protein [Comamonadaceae bacterium]